MERVHVWESSAAATYTSGYLVFEMWLMQLRNWVFYFILFKLKCKQPDVASG